MVKIRNLSIIAMMVSCICVHAAPSSFVIFEDFSFASQLYDNTGTAFSTGTYLFQLIADTSGDTDVSSMIGAGQFGIGGASLNGASDDLVVGTGLWDVDGGNYISAVANPAAGGQQMYIRFFDASTEGAATFAGFIYDNGPGNWVSPAASDPAPVTPLYMDLSKVGADAAFIDGTGLAADGWQTTIAVPEPGTIALFLMGLMTFGVRGLKRKK